MSLIEVIQFEPWHAAAANIREHEAVRLGKLGFDTHELFKQYKALGPAFTLFKNYDIIGFGGALKLLPGVAETWLFGTPYFVNNKVLVYKSTKQIIANILNEGFHRIQCSVQASDVTANNFAKRLGFVYEGTMRSFGLDKEDFNMYGLIK